MTRSVLLADDSISIHEAVQEALAGFDVALEVVYDGEEAAKFLESRPPDLVLTDVHMPGKNGYEVATLAKEARSDLPVILLCGTFESFDADAFESSRAEACLRKPFVAADLIEQMTELLGPLPATASIAAESVPVEPEVGVEEEAETGAEAEVTAEAAGASEEEAAMKESLAAEAEASHEEAPAVTEEETARHELEAAEAEEEVSDEEARTAADEKPAVEEAWVAEVAAPDEEAGEANEEKSAVEESSASQAETLDEDSPAASEGLAVEGIEEVGATVEAPVTVDRLSDEDVDRVARRVVELAGDGVLREIAWEVVPDLAEVIVRERLDKLESELEQQS